MKTMKKNFVQGYFAEGCEATNPEWKDIKDSGTYEEEKEFFFEHTSPWYQGVRLVEKTFDPETFTVTVRVIKTVTKDFWTREFVETDG